jgi:RimJ/RimL family protein N-acetyltransferase
MGITSIGLIHPATVEFGQLCGYGTVATETPAAFHWAATMIGEDEVAGYAGLNRIDVASRQGELRILVGTGNKNSGYAIEWAVAILRWALVGADFGRVYALQLTRHPIAGQVLSTVGMLPEAMLRKRLHHDGPFEDVVCWSITKEEWIDRCPTT